jgi:hypothetical protein
MKLAPMSSRARRRKCSGNGSAATAARATNAFAIQTPERMRAFPSERMVQPVPTSLGHSCRGGVNLLDGSRRRQDATTRVTAGSVKPTLSSRRAGSLPCAQRRHSGDVGLRESFGICQRPEDANTLESSQGEPCRLRLLRASRGRRARASCPTFRSCAAGGIALIGRRPVALCLAC